MTSFNEFIAGKKKHFDFGDDYPDDYLEDYESPSDNPEYDQMLAVRIKKWSPEQKKKMFLENMKKLKALGCEIPDKWKEQTK